MLHRVGRRAAPRGLCDPGAPGGRAGRHHPRRHARRTTGPLGRRLRRHRGQPVWVLYAGHSAASGRAGDGRPGTGADAARRRGCAAGAPVPLHRVAVHPRGGRSRARLGRGGAAGRARPGAGRGVGRLAGPARGMRLPALGRRRRAGRWGLRRRRRPARRRGPAGRRRTADARPPGRSGRDGAGPGPQQHCGADRAGAAARGHLVAHAADHLGRAGLRGARRQLEPAG